jgi:HEAT repeat protein
MTESDILLYVALALAALLLATLVLLVAHGTWRALSDERWRRPLAEARAALAQTADRLELAPAHARALQRLPDDRRIDLFAEIAQSVAGAPRSALAEAAAQLGVIARAERWCGSRWWRRRLRGTRLLTTLGGGDEAVPPLLDDPRPEVRAQAAEWAAGHGSEANVRRLTAMLGDPLGLARFTVMDSLIRLGASAVEPLRDAIAGAGHEPVVAARRDKIAAVGHGAVVAALRVGAAIGDPRLAAGARERLADDDPAVRAWAVRLVGAVGGDENAAAVVGRLADPAEEVRAAAAVALGRLGHWPAAPELAARLSDESWLVRRNAALALRSLGPAGELLLGRALREEDRFARDIARQTLDLPEPMLPA